MAKASIVSAQQQQLLRDINGKLDLLLKQAGLTYQGAVVGESPKPTKTFLVPAEPPKPAPVVEPEAVKPAKKGK